MQMSLDLSPIREMWSAQVSKILPRLRMQPELVDSSQMPKWLLDNPYIKSGYRKYRDSGTVAYELWSVLQLHNQSFNVWTHMAGLLLCQYQFVYSFPIHLTEFQDVFFLSLSYVGIMMSFLCSVIYHLFNTGTFEMSRFLSQVDYFGIILHLIGVMLSLVYYSFYHHSYLQVAYVLMYFVIGVVCLVMNYYCMFSSVTNRMDSAQRSAFFIFIACLSLPPQFYIGYLYSWKLTLYALTSDSIYVLAALVYSSKYPEKIYPGSFDLFNSHTIFHLLIITAGYGSTQSLNLLSHAAINYK